MNKYELQRQSLPQPYGFEKLLYIQKVGLNVYLQPLFLLIILIETNLTFTKCFYAISFLGRQLKIKHTAQFNF